MIVMAKTLSTRIVHKHDLEAKWLQKTSFVPMQGELIIYDIEVDPTGKTLALPSGRTEPYTYERMKIGDGKTAIGSLPFVLTTNDAAAKLATARKISLTGDVTGNTTFDGSSDISITATVKDDSHKHDTSTLINNLTTGDSAPQDADYYISQYAGGGTATTSYHRRPHSALWNYIKGKISSVLGLSATSYSGNAATASNVAWSGITSKPSYYDAKAIKSITRNGTTFTYTCLDGTIGTFTQQDNNTYTLASFGVTATADELNYTAGVTSNIQTQLNEKQVKPKLVKGECPNTKDKIKLNDNTEYRYTNVKLLELEFPTTDFECWIRITVSTDSTATVGFPGGTSFIGDKLSTYEKGKTYEISIKDKVVIIKKVDIES